MGCVVWKGVVYTETVRRAVPRLCSGTHPQVTSRHVSKGALSRRQDVSMAESTESLLGELRAFRAEGTSWKKARRPECGRVEA